MTQAPTEIDTLCTELGISHKRRGRLAAEYGDGLLRYLQRLWVQTREHPRLLHRNPGAGRSDYTDTPARAMWGEKGGEPEAVTAEVQAGITADSHAQLSVLRAEENHKRDVRSLANRLKEVSLRARRTGADLSPEIEQVRAALVEAERKLGRAA